MRKKITIIIVAAVAAGIGCIVIFFGRSGEQPLSSDASESPLERKIDVSAGGSTGELSDNSSAYEVASSDAIRVISSPEISDVPIASEYEALFDKATAGDREAAYVLGKKLARCKGNIVSQEDLPSLIVDMQTTFQVEDSQTGDRYTVNDIQPHIDQLRADVKFCEELQPEQAEETYHWLEVASDAGFIPATIELANTPPPDIDPETDAAEYYLKKRRSRLQNAWEQGSVDALFWIAMDYLNGVTTEKNNLEAYARLLVVRDKSKPERYQAIDKLIDDLGNRMSLLDLQAAKDLSEELSNSPNCCVVLAEKDAETNDLN